jgi:hypothetical protein
MSETLTVKWIDRGREPRCAADPQFPEGMDLDFSRGATNACETAVPYPAKRVGYYVVSCDACGFSCIVTTAGRRDDPRSVRVPCKRNEVQA